MHIEIALRKDTEYVAIERRDGSRTSFSIPRKGPIPHDAYHLVVESVFGIADGFWGRVARGEDPQQIQKAAAMGGHASSKRAMRPDTSLIAIIQAERLVECFEAETWSGQFDDDGLRAMATAGWEASFVPPIDLQGRKLDEVRKELNRIAEVWASMREGEVISLEWQEN